VDFLWSAGVGACISCEPSAGDGCLDIAAATARETKPREMTGPSIAAAFCPSRDDLPRKMIGRCAGRCHPSYSLVTLSQQSPRANSRGLMTGKAPTVNRTATLEAAQAATSASRRVCSTFSGVPESGLRGPAAPWRARVCANRHAIYAIGLTVVRAGRGITDRPIPVAGRSMSISTPWAAPAWGRFASPTVLPRSTRLSR
jgi:hypothetical protein